MAIHRIRDPLHDLIELSSDSELERVLWKVLQTRPFQRLRRIKQLGFSDLVYPGATHSRFAHSVGVFHTARQLMAVVHRSVKSHDTKEQRALAAALVHDLGHGPFSHAFEKVGLRLGLKLADHEAMSDALVRTGEVAEILNEMGRGFADDVADIIKKDGVKTIQHAVVSSQFDADRLDYIRRDRLMTGSQHAGIDFKWLIANLEVGEVPIGVDDASLGKVETFVLGPKAIYAAEAFVLGLFQLYPTVYFHKATRGAEKIFTELLVRVVSLVKDGSFEKVGLPQTHPLVRFAEGPDDVDKASLLDDTVLWGSLAQMSEASDELVKSFSTRLHQRKLLKCYDIRLEVSHGLDPKGSNTDEATALIDRCCASIGAKVTDFLTEKRAVVPSILIDDDQRSPYKPVGQSKGPLDRINIRTDGGELVDLKERSGVVAALKTFKLFRAYTDGTDTAPLRAIVREEIEACRTRTQ